MKQEERISSHYLALQRELHRNPNYGIASLSFASLVKQIIVQSKVQSVCDYGAGKCNLKLGLQREGLNDFTYFPYDPAFPEYGKPQPADLVCCIDVLEHIEIDYLCWISRSLQGESASSRFIPDRRTSSSAMGAMPT